MPVLLSDKVLATYEIAKLKVHLQVAVHNGLFNTIIATLHCHLMTRLDVVTTDSLNGILMTCRN
jgi:hypothetical protein